MLRTKKEIKQKVEPCGKTFTIPAHTPVIPATNLPQGGYWVEKWSDELDDHTDSVLRNIGFHVTEDEVEECE